MTTTFERLSATLINDYKISPDALVLDAPLEALGIDSLGAAELLFNIEDDFGVTLPSDVVALTTIGDVVAFIDDLVAKQRNNIVATPLIEDAVVPAV